MAHELRVFAAGSLKLVMNRIIEAVTDDHGINATYGPSGKLKKQIESGDNIFASASIAHIDALKQQLRDSGLFARNALCL
ncbi:MAG: substrate-binding domain-containing protein, partial [Burkholderiales bacterium]